MRIIPLIIILSLGSAATASEEPVLLGTFKGSAKDYFPHLVVSGVRILSDFSTYGGEATIVDSAQAAVTNLMNQQNERAKLLCKNSAYYALDQLEVEYRPMDYKNIFTSVTANAVCLNR